MTQSVTLRKTIDFTEEQVRQMEVVRLERKVTFNELMGQAWDVYLASFTTPRTDHLSEPLEQIQQRLWNLESSSQKTAERLAAIETLMQQNTELLLLLSEAWAASGGTGEPERLPDVPVSDNVPETDEGGEPKVSRWAIPHPEVVVRKWYERKGR